MKTKPLSYLLLSAPLQCFVVFLAGTLCVCVCLMFADDWMPFARSSLLISHLSEHQKHKQLNHLCRCEEIELSFLSRRLLELLTRLLRSLFRRWTSSAWKPFPGRLPLLSSHLLPLAVNENVRPADIEVFLVNRQNSHSQNPLWRLLGDIKLSLLR